ncbi:uncharacterized protein N7469_009701 [Penicillium citrinum]|uniref:SWIRM domain-containing protein n=2 Tax=Penicillium TaxID=5073 RepID=A0A9W9NIW8_PENCI|nr:uncharacterized protein N7469_009701 [Penicillium citrinum]KAJ5220814.1 hypothetical protein N7469_009701 [Penicillium citrinum]KAJ5595827.1 hypothetical protein N7450_002285 [Penicillium hetheringtonii]KAK5798532.1 hypothetical protein VI817_004822 [Penicillium citrinum]
MNRLPVSSLMSPPESKPFESFNSSSPFTKPDNNNSTTPTTTSDIKLPPISADRKRTQSEMDLPSPPVTPYTGAKKRRSHTADQIDRDVASSRDPLLFSSRHDSVSGLTEEQPLFGPIAPPTAAALVDQHIISHMARFENKRNKPTREEYLLALSCVPVVSTHFNRNPAAWAREERETLERQLVLMNRNRPADLDARLKKIAPAPAKKSGVAPPRVPRTRVRRTPKSTPKQQALDDFHSSHNHHPHKDASSPPSAKPRALGTNRDDTDFNALQDFSPPMEILAGNTKALKADWKGQMLDLSNDPDRHLLSPAELNLASTLRLSCATYLCSKRRIFEARVRALGVGKEFRKTDAQQACKIDVNKASKLWTAYDRVGFFRRELFQEYV